jgi:hypothetical protein
MGSAPMRRSAPPPEGREPRPARAGITTTMTRGCTIKKRRDEPSGGDFAHGEETLPRDERVGSFADTEDEDAD